MLVLAKRNTHTLENERVIFHLSTSQSKQWKINSFFSFITDPYPLNGENAYTTCHMNSYAQGQSVPSHASLNVQLQGSVLL